MKNLQCALTVTETGMTVHGNSLEKCVKNLTRRELFKEMASKDALKKVMSAWYGFSVPLDVNKKKDSLLTKVKTIDMKFTNNNRKEG